jgi:hypothetical protein
MRKIKKINELFDDEHQKWSQDEIRALSGKVKDEVVKMIKKGEIYDFKDIPELGRLLKQTLTSYPFLSQAVGRAITPDGIAFIFTDSPFSNNAFIVQFEGEDGMYSVKYGEVMDGVEHSEQKLGLSKEQMLDYIGKEVYPKFKEAVEDFKEQQGVDILHPDPTKNTDDPIFKDLQRPNFDPQFNSIVHNFDDFVYESNDKIAPVEVKMAAKELYSSYVVHPKHDFLWILDMGEGEDINATIYSEKDFKNIKKGWNIFPTFGGVGKHFESYEEMIEYYKNYYGSDAKFVASELKDDAEKALKNFPRWAIENVIPDEVKKLSELDLDSLPYKDPGE